jgi:hypothetical protein
VNVRGLLFTVQKALPLLQGSGSIVVERVDCRDEGKSSQECLQRDESGGSFVCAHMDCRFEGA